MKYFPVLMTVTKLGGGSILDISKAFDKVWHEGIIHKLNPLMPGV